MIVWDLVSQRWFSGCPEYSEIHVVQTGPGARQAVAVSPGLKRRGREADHSTPASAEDKKMWIYTSTPPYAFMA
jgi:hypothetical protein